MFEHLADELRLARKSKVEAEVRISRLEDLIKSLLDNVSDSDRVRYLAELQGVQGASSSQNQLGELPNNVIQLFATKAASRLTVPEVQVALEKKLGGTVDLKALYNALNYLVRTGRLQRVARGQYAVEGTGVFGPEFDFLEDGTHRTSEHDA
ncbi:hypothetical protein C5L14_05125 [Labrys okinawensis]|uniref:Uncharacterized protein n=2 Tax=Labrys okinawensis TaxID=346911 RepID=A0A2S9QGY4_9HYPH|nr:hypothetical protein C5L14_05125 [Labrys okinawensis]